MRTYLGLILALAGCGGGTMTGDGGNTPDLSMGGSETCTTDSMPVALAKHYGVRGTLNVNVKVTADCMGDGCIFNQDTTSTILLLADVTQNGQSATVTARPCSIKI